MARWSRLGTPTQLKSEIGGDVVLLDAHHAQKLALAISAKFEVAATVLDDGRVRIERNAGHHFITEVVEAFPGEIEAVSVSKPTLEDVLSAAPGTASGTKMPKDSKLAPPLKPRRRKSTKQDWGWIWQRKRHRIPQ